MGQNYGKLRGRRRGSGAWQWMLIGFFPGIMLGGLVIFLLVLSGTLSNLGPEATPVVVTSVVEIREIITTTPQPPQIITVVSEPTIDANAVVVTSPEPTLDNSGGSVVIPEATPTTNPADLITPTVEVTPTTASVDPVVPDTTTNQSSIPDVLAPVVSQLVPIPGGVFEMGTTNAEIVEAARQCQERDGGQCPASDGTDSTPVIRVELDAFQMEVTEVSFGQYVTFLNWLSSQGQRHTTACSGLLCIQTTNENPTGAVITFDSANYNVNDPLLNYPVYGVTWYGAQAYCEAIGRRLPSEAEWEHAARTANGYIYPWGNNWSAANANTRIPLDEEQGPTLIGAYPRGVNEYNLQDMSGNLAEWTQDWYDSNYYGTLANQPQPVLNPTGPISGTQRVLRGGSYNVFPFYARTVHRQSFFPVPDSPNDDYPRYIGFRCAADAEVVQTGVNVPAVASDNTATSVTTLPTLAPVPETDNTGDTSRG